MILKKLLCGMGIHFYEYRFIPYSDQPFAGDEGLCVVEGKHRDVCRHCEIEKPCFDF